MPPCKKEIIVTDGRGVTEKPNMFIAFECIDGEGHEGMHQAHYQGPNGYLKTIFWKD